MTTKRFVNYFDKDHNYIIQDLVNEDEYQVGFVNCDEDVFLELINQLNDENEQLKQQLKELKEDVPLLLAFYRWYPFAVEKKEHQAYNRLWDFVND